MMTLWQILETAFGIVLFIGWLCCIVDWVRGGCRVPKHIHYVALGALALGILVAILAPITGKHSIPGILFTVFLFPAMVYGLWLLCFGLWESNH